MRLERAKQGEGAMHDAEAGNGGGSSSEGREARSGGASQTRDGGRNVGRAGRSGKGTRRRAGLRRRVGRLWASATAFGESEARTFDEGSPPEAPRTPLSAGTRRALARIFATDPNAAFPEGGSVSEDRTSRESLRRVAEERGPYTPSDEPEGQEPGR